MVQAIANDAGPAGQALRLLDENVIQVYVSRAVMKELRAVLKYSSVREKLPSLDDQRVEAFIEHLLFRAKMLRRVRHVFNYPRATQDEPYIDLAVAANAGYLVTRDKDLLSLTTDHTLLAKQFRQRFPHLRIMNPVAFVQAVGRE